jgi:2,3-bisphosphoglycerate-independent phosphoglycerate mutase
MGPDHYTPVQKRTHVDTPVPFVVIDDGVDASDSTRFTESDAAERPLVTEGWNEMARWFAGEDTEFTG